jgi:hypothetical protein
MKNLQIRFSIVFAPRKPRATNMGPAIVRIIAAFGICLLVIAAGALLYLGWSLVS